jgi:hypothetical protein
LEILPVGAVGTIVGNTILSSETAKKKKKKE